MTILVIHAPDYAVKKGGKKSFEAVLADGIGEGYLIFPKEIEKLSPGSKVVLLRKDKNQKRAEGILVKLEQVYYRSLHRVQKRYDVHIQGLKEVTYKPEKLTRRGVALIDDC